MMIVYDVLSFSTFYQTPTNSIPTKQCAFQKLTNSLKMRNVLGKQGTVILDYIPAPNAALFRPVSFAYSQIFCLHSSL